MGDVRVVVYAKYDSATFFFEMEALNLEYVPVHFAFAAKCVRTDMLLGNRILVFHADTG